MVYLGLDPSHYFDFGADQLEKASLPQQLACLTDCFNHRDRSSRLQQRVTASSLITGRCCLLNTAAAHLHAPVDAAGTWR